MNKKIIIKGAGKLTAAIIEGLISLGIPASQIVVVGREKTDFSRVLKFNVSTTSDFSEVLEAGPVFFAVQPKHVGGLAHEITQAKEAFFIKNQRQPVIKVISLISNLSPEEVSNHFAIPLEDIVCATMDTNVAKRRGIIPYASLRSDNNQKSIKLLAKLGDTREGSFKSVVDGIVLIGAGKALDVKFLKLEALRLIFSSKDTSAQNDVTLVTKFVKDLHTTFSANRLVYDTAFLGWSTGSISDTNVKSYLTNRAKAIETVYGYQWYDALIISVQTFVNTVAVLAQEEEITTELFDSHIKEVATEGGCTEKGLAEINSIKDVTSLDKLVLFFYKVRQRTEDFKNDIANSFILEEGNSVNVELQKIARAHQKGSYVPE